MVLGKLKGSSFEREICKRLSFWISNNSRDDIFWRTSSSGGRYTFRKKFRLKDTYNQAGDVTNIHPDGEFFVKNFILELKFYKKIDIWDLFGNKDKKVLLLDWWYKLNDECQKVNKIPMLIVKENYKPTLLLTNSHFGNFLEKEFNFEIKVVWNPGKENIVIGLLDDFLKIDVSYFKERVAKLNLNS
jgi:hypothetical protein